MLGIVMEKDDRAVFNLFSHLFANAFGRGVIFPVKAVNIRYKSNIIIGAFPLIVLITNVMMWLVKTEKRTTALIVVNTNVPINIVHQKNLHFLITVLYTMIK